MGGEIEYYSLLGISRTANIDDIRAAYKKLASTYHPDRHTDPILAAEAGEKFTLIRSAYETLIDDKKRSLYDIYGIEGLKAGWELCSKAKTPDDVRKLFEQMKKNEEEAQIDQRVNARGVVKMSIRATDLIDVATGQRNLPEMTGMSISQNIMAPFSSKDIATFGGSVSQKNGNGESTLAVGWRRYFTNDIYGFIEIATSQNNSVFQIGTWKRMSRQCVAQFRTTIHRDGISATATCERQIAEKTMAHISWTVADNPNIRLSLQHTYRKSTFEPEITLDENDVHVALGFSKKLSKNSSLRFTGGFNWNLQPELSVGATRAISKNSDFGFAVKASTQSLYITLSYRRVGQKFSFPILLTNDVTWQAVLASICIPTIIAALLKVFVIKPRKKLRKARKLEKLRKENAETTDQAKKSAEAAIRLMTSAVQRKQGQEEQKQGLIIVEARYGNITKQQKEEAEKLVQTQNQSSISSSSSNQQEEYPYIIDVTIPIQYIVEDSQLHLYNTPKSNLLGFYDPCIGEPKQLYIRYLFRDKLHEVTIHDAEAIALPLQSHRID